MNHFYIILCKKLRAWLKKECNYYVIYKDYKLKYIIKRLLTSVCFYKLNGYTISYIWWSLLLPLLH